VVERAGRRVVYVVRDAKAVEVPVILGPPLGTNWRSARASGQATRWSSRRRPSFEAAAP